MTMKKMTIGYVRCSTNVSQDVEHQINSIKDYSTKNDLVVDKIIKDEGISAFRKSFDARDGMVELLDMAHRGEIDNLIVFESSRISRGFIEGQTLIDELSKCNIRIHSVSDNGVINGNELDAIMNAFKFFMNNNESKKISARVKSAHQLLRDSGKWASGSVPFGYKLENGYAVIDEVMRDEIVEMFEDYIVHGSKYTQEKHRIKNRKTLIDRISHKSMEEVVGKDLFLRANKVKDSRKCTKRNSAMLNRTDILFESMLYHGCGTKLYINKDYRLKNKSHIYRCHKCKGNSSVKVKKSFSGPKLDANIEAEVIDILNGLDHTGLTQRYNSRCTKKKVVMELQLKNLKNELNEVNAVISKAKDKLTVLILNDADDNAIAIVSELIKDNQTKEVVLLEDIANKESEINKLIDSEIINESLIKDILRAKDIYINADIQQKKTILQLLIDKIVIRDYEDFDIYLRI